MLTCYDYPTALWEEEAGVDVVFVGDSVGTNVLGYASETEVTMDDMAHHLKAVRRGVREAYLLADLPFGSADTPGRAVENGLRLASLGADGVKLEGFKQEAVRALRAEGLDVWGHLGLTPPVPEGERALQAKTAESAAELALAESGARGGGCGFPRARGGAGGSGRGRYPAPVHTDDRHRRGPLHRRPGDRRFRPARGRRPRAAPRRPARRQQGGWGAGHQSLRRRGCGKGAFPRKGTCGT